MSNDADWHEICSAWESAKIKNRATAKQVEADLGIVLEDKIPCFRCPFFPICKRWNHDKGEK